MYEINYMQLHLQVMLTSNGHYTAQGPWGTKGKEAGGENWNWKFPPGNDSPGGGGDGLEYEGGSGTEGGGGEAENAAVSGEVTGDGESPEVPDTAARMKSWTWESIKMAYTKTHTYWEL